VIVSDRGSSCATPKSRTKVGKRTAEQGASCYNLRDKIDARCPPCAGIPNEKEHRVKKIFWNAIIVLSILVMIAAPAAAQENVNTVQINYVACGDAGVINVSGTLVAGWDIYYQLFDSANGAGNALSSLRQLSVDGAYAVSERLPYANAATLATGATGSARVLIASESNSNNIDFQTTVNDVNDGCSNPQNAAATSADTGTGAPSGASSGSSTAVRILAPGSGFLNPNLEAEDIVFVGARPSLQFRSETPGLVFAECDAFQLANPGLIYDNDSVTIFWSWYTRTLDQMSDHLATAQYSIRLNTALLDNVTRSEPGRRGGVNQWVFYQSTVGNLQPGHYEVEYKLTWTEPHFDGYDDYGPGTENPELTGRCNFNILRNPNGFNVTTYNFKYFPTDYPVHDLLPGQ
jgi:hypothetical protein